MASPSSFSRATVTNIKQGDLKVFTSGEAATTAVTVGRVRNIIISTKPVHDQKDVHGKRYTVAIDVTVKAIIQDVDDALINRMLDYCATPMGLRIDYSELVPSTFAETSKYFSKDACPIMLGDAFDMDFGGDKTNELPIQTEFRIHPTQFGALFTTVS